MGGKRERDTFARAIFHALLFLLLFCCCSTAVCRHLASHLCKTLYEEEECVVTLFTSCSRDYSSYLKWGMANTYKDKAQPYLDFFKINIALLFAWSNQD